MKQEDKELLLKDLCARLPYSVKVLYQVSSQIPDRKFFDGKQYEELKHGSILDDWLKCTFKPYLFPLSSMTEEQRTEASFEFDSKKYKVNIFGDIESYSEIGDDIAYIDLESIGRYIDWLNKNHFDYRGLIKKDLAIDCTNLNIY